MIDLRLFACVHNVFRRHNIFLFLAFRLFAGQHCKQFVARHMEMENNVKGGDRLNATLRVQIKFCCRN